MTKQNFISAQEEATKDSEATNKRQALINSWSSFPNVESSELTVSDALSLRATLHGFSAELILIDRK
jgi:hypothetical protein